MENELKQNSKIEGQFVAGSGFRHNCFQTQLLKMQAFSVYRFLLDS